jgi:hypothetical protein
MNGVGMESAVAGASVVIDTVAPLLVGVDPVPGSQVVGLRPALTVTFSEPIATATWIDGGLIMQSATGALVAGVHTYDVTARTGSFVPSAALQPGALYAVTVGNVEDVAGNRVASPGSWSITPLTPTNLAATATPRVILHGGSTRIGITLTGGSFPASVEVMSAASPAGFVPFTAISTDDGTNFLVATPPSNTTFRFRYDGAFGIAPAQKDVRVLVRRSIVLLGRSSGSIAQARVGASVTLTASIGPATSGVSVSFKLYRFDGTRRSWVYAGSKGRKTDAAGRASLTWAAPSAGSYYWRVAVSPTVDFANNTSPVYRWSINR